MFKNDDEVLAPSKPHLGVLTKTGMIAIPVGTVLAIVEDPMHIEGSYLLVLREVSHKEIVFDALSKDKENTRRVKFVAKWVGDFKSWWRKAEKIRRKEDVPTEDE